MRLIVAIISAALVAALPTPAESQGAWSGTNYSAESALSGGVGILVACVSADDPAAYFTFSGDVPDPPSSIEVRWDDFDTKTYTTGRSAGFPTWEIAPLETRRFISALRASNSVSVRIDGVEHAWSLAGSERAIGSAFRNGGCERQRTRRTAKSPPIRNVCDLASAYPNGIAIKGWLVGWFPSTGIGGEPIHGVDFSEPLQIILDRTGRKQLQLSTVAMLAGC